MFSFFPAQIRGCGMGKGTICFLQAGQAPTELAPSSNNGSWVSKNNPLLNVKLLVSKPSSYVSL